MIVLLNKFISKNYDEILRYTKYFVTRLNSSLEPDAIINNAYLQASKSKYQATQEHEVKAMFLHLIKCELLWNSESKKEIFNVTDEKVIFEDLDDFQSVQEYEKEFANRLEIMENYRTQINDRIKLIFFETYYDKMITTTRTMAKHFNISHASAHFMIKEMLEDIKQFEKYGQYK